MLSLLPMPILAAVAVALALGGAAGLRSCSEGRAAAVALDHTRTALAVASARGRQAVDATVDACSAAQAARDAHIHRLEDALSDSAAIAAPEPDESLPACSPDSPVSW